ncbi:MAG: FAD-dependent oxidoreductase [Deltaproteobacteria bacterium]|nr:FAD-dependent oxidoreductase [Deltaproteobacteria bacterium]
MNQLETDVAVIGGGAAGLAAAISAAEGGASVMVFEKASTTGGAGNMAFGPFAVESRIQRLKQIALTREEAFKIHMDYTHWRVDARLVKAYIDRSASTIDWLEKMGVEFYDVSCHNPGFPFTWHIIKGVAGSVEKPALGSNMIRIMTERAKDLKVRIYLRTPAKGLLRKGGRIEGIVAEDSAGDEIRVRGKAAIIATGGFGDNPKMIKKYTGFDLGLNLFSLRIPGCTGDGVRMAWEAGASPTEMIMHLTPLRVPELDDFSLESFLFRQPNLIVNLEGERFMNEETMGNPTFVTNAVSRQKNGFCFIIFDQATRRRYERHGLDLPPDGVATSANPNIQDAGPVEVLDRAGSENIFVADSISELADKIGVDHGALQKTIAEYNRACETGRDELFHKKARYLRPVKEPRFYAGRLFPGAIGSLGGIKVNYRTEVLDRKQEVIPGLYAAGTDANALYGDSYAFVLPGNTLGFALNSGRIAGENAAEYARSLA